VLLFASISSDKSAVFQTAAIVTMLLAILLRLSARP
jgi:hypothetical protein